MLKLDLTEPRGINSFMTHYSDLSNAVRFLSVHMVEKAQSGHPGMPLGMADVATILFHDFLNFNPKDPAWLGRDRFILSAGHGSALLYSLLYLTGYEQTTLEELKNFRQLGARTAGHPEYGHMDGIETTTGPLGQGLATGVGIALGQNMQARNRLPKTYVLVSDGDLMEGISQEAISFAGHMNLRNLIVLYDDNHISIDGHTDLSFSDETLNRFEACHWAVRSIDGHNYDEIIDALTWAQTTDKPTLIACKTTIGRGAPNKAGKSSSHGSPLGKEEIEGVERYYNWPHAPFHVPETILSAWRSAFKRCKPLYEEVWERPFSNKSAKAFDDLWQTFQKEAPTLATRVASQKVLDAISPHIPNLIGGSADLTGSCNTKAQHQNSITADNFSGNYIHYGVREHAMGAIMNGLALQGFVPYGGTFLVFSDYLRPALRLSALMNLGVIYVLTHDSIGLGEDGPTHQPIEHLASLRAMPNVLVFRPADALETLECWQLALAHNQTPSVLALTRQSVPFLNMPLGSCAKGAYVLKGVPEKARATLLATGSEVSLALKAHEHLQKQGIETVVVSMPCFELFDAQPEDYKQKVLGTAPRIAVEAACDFGWHKYVGEKGAFVGMRSFGASGPAEKLYETFGITVDAIIKTVLERI
jgi:transketolase